MGFYKFIRLEGIEGNKTGYFVPKMYNISSIRLGLKIFGFQFIKDRLSGCSIWGVENETDYNCAIKTLDELKKTRIFDYKVWRN